MQIPNISQYITTVADPAGLTRTLGEFVAERDNYGEIKPRSGNNAAVFRIEHCGKDRMLKCYTRPRADLADIYDYIARNPDDPLFPAVEYLPQELYVFDAFGDGSYYDVLWGQWLDGPTLDTEIARACREGNRERLETLSMNFDRFAGELLAREWAHGDLKPENIVVSPEGDMGLIDFDALYYPGNHNTVHPEIGTPGYQHPSRERYLYDKCIDDYPLALISVSLKALSLDPGLYAEFNRSDIILMNPVEILSGNCPAYKIVKQLFALTGSFGHYRLVTLLGGNSVAIPGLAGILGRLWQQVSLHEECQITNVNGFFGFAFKGMIMLEPTFEALCAFRNGAALATIDGMKKLIAYDGRYLLPGLEYEDVKPLSEGLAAFCLDGKWGYAAADGRVVTEPQYESAGNFHDGFAPVRLNGKWGYIDRQGRCLGGFIFDEALGFRNGCAEVVKDGKIFFITGESVVKRQD